MPSFIPATGITLHLAGVCVNRIGVDRSSHPARECCAAKDHGSSTGFEEMKKEYAGDDR